MTTLLAGPAGSPPDPRRRARAGRPDRPRRGRRGRARSPALRRVVRDLGPTGDGRDDRRLRPARARRRRASRPARSGAPSCPPADPVRYVVVNGYEADPAAGHGPHLLETRPFAVVEGVAIAAFAVGAREAIIAVRAEYADAAAGARGGRRRRRGGRLPRDRRPRAPGTTSRSPSARSRAPTCSARRRSCCKALEGKRGQPEQRPPYPTERGLFGQPTVVHNVATLAAVPWIVRHGADAFAAIGDPAAPGTVLVQVGGAVAAPGIAEVPTGTPLREILDLAGGVAAGRTLKAVLVGGPSGGLLPPELLDTPVHVRGRCATAGAHVGSGVDRRRRRARLHRRPRPPPHPLLRRRGLRQDDPLPDRHAPPRRDRRALRRRHGAADRPAAPRGPRRRHRGQRPVRPRARRPARSERRCDTSGPSSTTTSCGAPAPPASAPDPARGRRPRKVDDRTMADLISRPADLPDPAEPRPSRPPRRSPSGSSSTQAPQRPAVDAAHPARGRRPGRRGPRGPDDPRGLPRQRDRDPDPLLRAEAARLRGLPDVRRRGRGRGAPADLLLARRRGRDGGPDPDRGGPPAAADEPRADLLRPQRLLPAALPEQVPEPHRHPGLPEGQRRGRLPRVGPHLQADDPVPLDPRPRLPGAVRGALPPRRGGRGDRDPRQPPLRRRPGPPRDARGGRRPAGARSSSSRRPAGGSRSSAPGRPACRPPTTCSSPATT